MAEPAELTPEQIADLQQKAARVDSLDAQYKGLQRELEKAREGSATARHLERRLTSLREEITTEVGESVRLTVLETLGKLGIEGLNTSEEVAKIQTGRKARADVSERIQVSGQAIVSAFRAANIPDDQFDSVWRTDERFADARGLWGDGSDPAKAAQAVVAVVKAFTTKTKEEGKNVETFTKEQVEELLAAEREKLRLAGTANVDISGGNTPVRKADTATARRELAEIRRRMENGVDSEKDHKRLGELSLILAGL